MATPTTVRFYIVPVDRIAHGAGFAEGPRYMSWPYHRAGYDVVWSAKYYGSICFLAADGDSSFHAALASQPNVFQFPDGTNPVTVQQATALRGMLTASDITIPDRLTIVNEGGAIARSVVGAVLASQRKRAAEIGMNDTRYNALVDGWQIAPIYMGRCGAFAGKLARVNPIVAVPAVCAISSYEQEKQDRRRFLKVAALAALGLSVGLHGARGDTTVATEDFAGMGNNDQLSDDANWDSAFGGGDLDITAEQCRPDWSVNEQCDYWAGSGSWDDDQWSQITITSLSGGPIGAAARCSAGTYAGLYYMSTKGWMFVYYSATWHALGSTGGGASDSDVVKIVAEGTTFTPYKNGGVDSSIGADTDSNVTTGVGGVTAYDDGKSTADNWSGGNTAEPPAPSITQDGGQGVQMHL